MRRDALIASGCLHLAVIALVYFGLPSLFHPKPIEDSGPVSVEVVTLPDKAPAPPPAPAAKPAPTPPARKTPPAPKTPPPPPEKAAPPPPPPPEPEAVKIPEPTPAPKPKPKPVVQPKPEPAPKPKPVEEAKAPPRPKHKPKPPAPPQQTLASLLKDVRKDLKSAPPDQKKKPSPEKPKDLAKDLLAGLEPKPQAQHSPAPAQSALSKFQASQLVGMVRNQISPCWSVPIGAKDARDMRIDIRIALNPDGTLRGMPSIEDQARMRSDPIFRAFAESALRAIQDPRCSPLRLPADRYSEWSDMIIAFNPKELAGP